jgi:hypothetical protein
VKVVFGWRCLECEEKGSGPEADKIAEKHGKNYKHGTVSWMKPEVGDGQGTDAAHDHRRGAGAVQGPL